eukprot:CAMPEP_0119548178 /NCGR_PEP_ID=MMETSP1352-20130426/2156_1 /TAXON_ID=265584 /ORGANISM="Stauroneis constricta, Strain CCMP1120" /LENGTH=189 /DNA_ID=CAMNT_0007593367 /DNA_START=236 /DNA_END=802 /DNA_ORIENTATION=+
MAAVFGSASCMNVAFMITILISRRKVQHLAAQRLPTIIDNFSAQFAHSGGKLDEYAELGMCLSTVNFLFVFSVEVTESDGQVIAVPQGYTHSFVADRNSNMQPQPGRIPTGQILSHIPISAEAIAVPVAVHDDGAEMTVVRDNPRGAASFENSNRKPLPRLTMRDRLLELEGCKELLTADEYNEKRKSI